MGSREAVQDWCINNPLCRGNLGIARSQMPQIREPEMAAFVEWVGEQGIRVTRGTTRADELHPTQAGISTEHVQKQITEGVSLLARRPLVRSEDGYILDGHHRWAAIVLSDPNRPIPTITVHVPIRRLLELAHAFPGVAYGHDVRARAIRLAYAKPELRHVLLDLLRR